MYSDSFASYYDQIHSQKNYFGEVSYILAAFEKWSSLKSCNKILDFGCGTGNHAVVLADMGLDVLGLDLSEEMISVAQNKISPGQSGRIRFVCGDLLQSHEARFDLVISMFNVINHISSVSDLYEIFRNIQNKLVPGGLFVFDCWSGIAVLQDPPKTSSKTILNSFGNKIVVNLSSECDFFNLAVKLKTEIIDERKKESFSVTMPHFLWPPKVLSDVLEMAGFEVCAITKLGCLESTAGLDDWKIAFIAKKGGQ